MKGRLYDAKLGRFLSADPFVQAPNNTQSYNRYSYVLNNPLSYTDPSGYFFNKIFDWVKDNIRTIAAIAVGFATAGLALVAYLGTGFALTGGGFIGSVIAGAAGAFGGTLAATGSLEAALTAGVFGALSGGLAWQIGHGAIGAAAGRVFGQAGSYIAHGVAQGAVSVLQGGKFKTGFIGGVVGHASQVTKSFIKGAGTTAVIARTMIAASAGGIAASLTGGKFGNGAMSAAFTHLFNAEGGEYFSKKHRLVFVNNAGDHGHYRVLENGNWETEYDLAPMGLLGKVNKSLGSYAGALGTIAIQGRDVYEVGYIEYQVYHETTVTVINEDRVVDTYRYLTDTGFQATFESGYQNYLGRDTRIYFGEKGVSSCP